MKKLNKGILFFMILSIAVLLTTTVVNYIMFDNCRNDLASANEENEQLTQRIDEYKTTVENTEAKLAVAESNLEQCSTQIEQYETDIFILEERIKELESEVKMLEEIIEISNTPSDWDYDFTEEEVVELGAMIFAEEEGDSFCAAGAASVAGNRVRRPDFPDNFHDVIYQIIKAEEHTYEQYAPRTKRIIEHVVAGKPIPKELADVPYIPDLYFNIARLILEHGPIFREDVIYQAHFKQGKGVYYEKDGEFFCYG